MFAWWQVHQDDLKEAQMDEVIRELRNAEALRRLEEKSLTPPLLIEEEDDEIGDPT